MSIHIMSSDPAFDASIAGRRTFAPTRSSRARSTVVIVVAVVAGYVAGVLVGDPLPRLKEPVAEARPVQVPERIFSDIPAAGTATTVRGADESRRFDPDRIEDPRECDLSKGISTACLFMD